MSRKSKHHFPQPRITDLEIAKILEDKALNRCSPDAWERFVGSQIDHPELEAIRQRCIQLPKIFPPEKASYSSFCSDEGRKILFEISDGLCRFPGARRKAKWQKLVYGEQRDEKDSTVCNVRLDPVTSNTHSNPNQFLFTKIDFEDALLDLCKRSQDWQPPLHLRQRYIYELTRRRMSVPDRVMLNARDAWVKTFTALRLEDKNAVDVECSPDEPLEISSEHPLVVDGLISTLLHAKKGVVFCEKCKSSYKANELTVKKWGGNGPPLADAGGSEFLCPEGHSVIQTVEWIS